MKEFQKHIKTLERSDKIRCWDDRQIKPGEEWNDEIKEALAAADVIFLLVSVGFLATDYIWNTELTEAMRRHHAKEVTVIPIKLRHCSWEGTPFSKLQGIPRKDKIIDTASNKDAIWTEVVKEIEELIEER